MIFCNIKDEYIYFLRQYDNKVADNKEENRPYVGVILEVDEILKTARNLRNLVLKDDSKLTAYDKTIKARCCNLALLESIYTEYRE